MESSHYDLDDEMHEAFVSTESASREETPGIVTVTVKVIGDAIPRFPTSVTLFLQGFNGSLTTARETVRGLLIRIEVCYDVRVRPMTFKVRRASSSADAVPIGEAYRVWLYQGDELQVCAVKAGGTSHHNKVRKKSLGWQLDSLCKGSEGGEPEAEDDLRKTLSGTISEGVSAYSDALDKVQPNGPVPSRGVSEFTRELQEHARRRPKNSKYPMAWRAKEIAKVVEVSHGLPWWHS